MKIITYLNLLLISILLPSQLSAQTPDRNRMQMALSFERRGNYDAALRIYESLYAEVPRNHQYYEGMKRNLLRLKQYDKLESVIEKQIQLTNNVRYQVDLGELYYNQDDYAGAIKQWNDILQAYPTQRIVYTYIANAMIVNRLYDEAVEVYKQGRRNFGQDHLFVYELANVYVMQLKYREATLEYLQHLARNPNEFNQVESRIANYTKEPEQAIEVAEVLKESLPRHKYEYLVRRLLANLYLRMEKFSDAMQQFQLLEEMKEPNVAQDKNAGKQLFYFAQKASQAGEYAFAEKSYELILANYENSPYRMRALFGLAEAKQRRGLLVQALQAYEYLLEISANTVYSEEATFQIGEIYFQQFELKKALAAYDVILQKFPGGRKVFEAYFRIGDCYAGMGDLSKAKTWYERSLTSPEIDWATRSQAHYKTAYLDFIEADFEAALEKLNQITAKMDQRNVDQRYVNDALELIFLIEENQKNSEPALKLYSAARKFMLQKKTDDAMSKLQEIVEQYPDAGIVDEALFDLGELENRLGNYPGAINYFTLLVGEHGSSVKTDLAQKRIAEIYETGLGDYARAYDAYEKVLVDYPQSIYLEEVRQKLRELQSRRVNN